jgi:hypothetical protein
MKKDMMSVEVGRVWKMPWLILQKKKKGRVPSVNMV